MTTLKQRATDAAERIMQSIEDRRCVLKEDVTREILTTLEHVEAACWTADPPPAIAKVHTASHCFRLAARLRNEGNRIHSDHMMRKGFEIMLGEGRLTREEFRVLMLQY